jgi:hypothetical protein
VGTVAGDAGAAVDGAAGDDSTAAAPNAGGLVGTVENVGQQVGSDIGADAQQAGSDIGSLANDLTNP